MRQIVAGPEETEAQIDDSLRHSIARLPVEQRLVFTLYYFEELSLDQIGQVVHEPEDRVAAQFYLAHANIGVVSMPSAVHEGAEELSQNRDTSGTRGESRTSHPLATPGRPSSTTKVASVWIGAPGSRT